MGVADLQNRTADRKQRGANQTYPEHAGKAHQAAAPPGAVALPVLRPACAHEGAIVEPCTTCAGDLRSVRDCDRHDRATRVFVSDKVRSCDRCPDYAPEVDRAGWITVPDPPALDLTPTSSRAVVTVVVGAEAEACFASSGPLMARYANRHGADLVVLRWPGHPGWPMSAKFAIGKVLDHYERIAYVDADVLLRPGCLDLFTECPADRFGFVDEMPWHRAHQQFGREQAHMRFRREMGFRHVDEVPWMMNAGVMVVPKSHRHVLMPPARIGPDHCAEQDHTNAVLLDSGLPIHRMDSDCNHQNWTDHRFLRATARSILHWSGAGADRVSRAEQMRRWAAPYLEPFDPPAPSHEWEIDRRHLLWLSEELLSGRHRRVLEIGSFRGYSTSAFLHALRVGAVDEVHLCDPAPTPELLALIDGVPGVTLHRCPSVGLLDRDDAARFDLVFVDGDHSAQTCTAEARLLIAAGVRCVMAHDTAGLHHCDGPPLLKAALDRAGYSLTEDAEDRPGERTDRGLLLARRSTP